jgi:hypothetical protein
MKKKVVVCLESLEELPKARVKDPENDSPYGVGKRVVPMAQRS